MTHLYIASAGDFEKKNLDSTVLKISNVRCIPKLSLNLLSVSHIVDHVETESEEEEDQGMNPDIRKTQD